MVVASRKEMVTPLVSVVLPTHNRASLLPRAISSVLSQSSSNFELIVVDDGSTDDSMERVGEFKDNRIVIERLPACTGAPHARNVGIGLSRGQFIAFLDSDDEWLPEKLEKQSALLLQSPGSVGCAGAGRDFRWRASGRTFSKQIVPIQEIGNIHRGLLTGRVRSGTSRWPGNTSSLMVRKECFETIGLFDERLQSAQDYDIIIRLSEYFDFVAVNEPLVIVHADAKTRITSCNANQMEGKRVFLDKYQKEFPFFSLLKARFSFQVGIQLMSTGDAVLGRKYLFQAVRSRPTAPAYWWNFAKNLMPSYRARRMSC